METLIGRSRVGKAPTKPAAKKPVTKPATKKKTDARTQRFLDALLGLKL